MEIAVVTIQQGPFIKHLSKLYEYEHFIIMQLVKFSNFL